MRSIILSIGCLMLFGPLAHAQKKVNRQYFINLLNAGEYDKAFDSANRLRKEVYGKNAVVDYFIAKCLCLDGHQKNATACFNRIIKSFKLSGNKKTFIEQEINTCNVILNEDEVMPSGNPDYSYINNISLPEASVGGKMGRVFNCDSKNQTINLTKMVSQEEMESRLFSINQKAAAVKKLRNIVGDQYKIDTAKRYVFITSKKFPLDGVSYAAENLEKAYRFFIDYYGLRAPDKLLTVYILPNQNVLRQTAELVHGIELPDPNIGYSNLSDLSLLGLGDARHLGTLYHELFHLMIRTDLGDIPAFLDEGLASLYSVSSWKNNQLVGDYRPWRLDELREARFARDRNLQIPALEKLINYGWDEFDEAETKNICQVAVNYALSNFVMIYLQEKNLLQEMVSAFKNRPFVPQDSGDVQSNLQIFEKVVKDSIKTFTLKFDKWFKEKYQFDLFNESGSSANRPVNMQELFEQTTVLLYEINEKVFKFKNPEEFKKLEKELASIKAGYQNLSTVNSSNINNPPANMVQQSMPTDPASIKKAEIQHRLEAFDKKLRKLIFDSLPKTAN